MTEIYINNIIKNKYNSPFRIPLRNKEGIIWEYSLVDEDDFEKVNKYKWCLMINKYAKGKIDGITKTLHSFIYGNIKIGNCIDHINRDPLDNRKNNLREVSSSLNNQNTLRKNDKTTSKYIGVRILRNKYISACQKIYLGTYDNEIEAARLYDICSYKIYGKNALNNRLISYEEAIKYNDTIYNVKDRKLPINIEYLNTEKVFRARKIYNNKTYYGSYRKTIIEAQNDLIDINIKINRIKIIKELKHYFTEITRDENGIAYILIDVIKVLVDDNVWHKFTIIKWKINKDGYAINGILGLMHRVVINANKHEIVDHINKNRYDNRLSNLRIAKAGCNSHNRVKKYESSSKYFGVSFNKRDNKWKSEIRHQNKRYSLGSFKDEKQAAEAYNKKAVELYGEFANLNEFP